MYTFMWLLGENRSTISFVALAFPNAFMGARKAVMDAYISYKFGGFLSGTSAVNAAQLCTAGINQHLG